MSKSKKYPARIPRFAQGIRVQETRTGAPRPWWARKWLSSIEPAGFGGRLARGRAYAISGQVEEIEIKGPEVSAKVVGTRPDLYLVSLTFKAPEPDALSRIARAIAAEPILAARLFADDLPTEIESIFRSEGCNLFPGGRLPEGGYDMTARCSCPDWAKTCKHVCAALLVLGEEVARRPLTLLELRGLVPEDICPEP